MRIIWAEGSPTRLPTPTQHAFYQAGAEVPGAAGHAHVALFNPAASGHRVVVISAGVILSNKPVAFELRHHTAALATASSVPVVSLNGFTGGSPVASLSYENSAASLGTLFTRLTAERGASPGDDLVATGISSLVEGFVLNEGQSLVFRQELEAKPMAAFFRWWETTP